MSKDKRHNEIALIVLTLTLIVLIILISIKIVTFKNIRLIKEAKQMKEKYQIAKQEVEENKLNKYNSIINNSREQPNTCIVDLGEGVIFEIKNKYKDYEKLTKDNFILEQAESLNTGYKSSKWASQHGGNTSSGSVNCDLIKNYNNQIGQLEAYIKVKFGLEYYGWTYYDYQIKVHAYLVINN